MNYLKNKIIFSYHKLWTKNLNLDPIHRTSSKCLNTTPQTNLTKTTITLANLNLDNLDPCHPPISAIQTNQFQTLNN